jgi:NADH-quinone oxidoreductase subunit L
MLVGTLAITGVGIPLTAIGFAGFLSKDAIIESAFAASQGAFWLLVVAAGMTSFYSWRLIFLTFYGAPRWGGHTANGHGAHGHGHAADLGNGYDALHGQGHGHGHGHDDHGHTAHGPHESPLVMLVPLGVLALGACFSGMIWYKVFFGDEDAMRSWFAMAPAAHAAAEGEGHAKAEGEGHAAAETAAADTATEGHAATEGEGHAATPHAVTGEAPPGAIFMGPDNHVIHDAHEAPKWVKVSPFVAMLTGLALAWLFYIRRPDLPGRLAAQQRPLYLFLLNKWYFDELFDWTIVRPAMWLARTLWKKGDGSVIDGGINGLAMGVIPRLTRAAMRLQSGYIFTYAFMMVVGITILVTWMALGGGN